MKAIFAVAVSVLVCATAIGQAPTPLAGEVVITELMANPRTVNDNFGEYFELCNISTHAVDLAGCSFGDLTQGSSPAIVNSPVRVIVQGPLIVQPGEFITFIRQYASTGWTFAGQHVDYACGASPGCVATASIMGMNNSTLATEGDGIVFLDPANVVLDAAGYGSQTASPAGSPTTYAGVFAGIPVPTTGSSAFDGGAYERIDLRLPWAAGNVGLSTPFIDASNHGTPGLPNSVDATRPWLRALAPPTIGTSVGLQMLSPRDANNVCYVAASLGNTPQTQIGAFLVDLVIDDIFVFADTPGNGIFNSFGANQFDAYGNNQAANLAIPNDPNIVGYTVYFQFATLDAAFNILAISESLALTLQ